MPVSVRDLALEVWLGLSLIAAATVWGIGSGIFEWPKWLAVDSAAAAALVFGLTRPRMAEPDRLDLASIALVAWMSLTNLWAPDPGYTWLTTTHAWALWLVLWGARQMDLSWILPAACGLSLFGIAGELWYFDAPFFGGSGNPNDLSQLVAVLALGGAALTFQYFWLDVVMFYVLLAAEIYLLCFSPSRMGFVALLPLVAAGFWKVFPRWYQLVPIGTGLLILGGVLYLNPDWFLRSALPRGQIWLSTLAMWADYPFFGVGLSGFEWHWNEYQSWTLGPPLGALWPHQTFLDVAWERPGAAHSDWLQGMTELGLVGAALMGWLVLEWGRRARGFPQFAVWGALALAAIDFPFQKPAVILAVLVVAAATAPKRGEAYG